MKVKSCAIIPFRLPSGSFFMNLSSISSFATIFAFYVAWTVFVFDSHQKKDNKKSEKRDILISIKKELELISSWLGTSYDSQTLNNRMRTWHPFDMVYGLGWNQSIRNAISMRSITLLSNDLVKLLVLFNQLLSNFENHVNKIVSFCSSNPTLATEAFYLHDRVLKKGRNTLWKYINTLYSKLDQGKKVTPAEGMLAGVNRMFRDLHIIGIGDENQNQPVSLRRVFIFLNSAIELELANLDREKQFKQPLWMWFLNVLIYAVFPIFVLLYYFITAQKGGIELMLSNSNYIDMIVIASIILASLVLAIIKYFSISNAYIGKPWQLKFLELWNGFVSFLIAGLIGFYFVLVRWPILVKGKELAITDFFLLIFFMLSIFAHLPILSKNITEGVETILKRVLEK